MVDFIMTTECSVKIETRTDNRSRIYFAKKCQNLTCWMICVAVVKQNYVICVKSNNTGRKTNAYKFKFDLKKEDEEALPVMHHF